jgi:hypothetical protein
MLQVPTEDCPVESEHHTNHSRSFAHSPPLEETLDAAIQLVKGNVDGDGVCVYVCVCVLVRKRSVHFVLCSIEILGLQTQEVRLGVRAMHTGADTDTLTFMTSERSRLEGPDRGTGGTSAECGLMALASPQGFRGKVSPAVVAAPTASWLTSDPLVDGAAAACLGW